MSALIRIAVCASLCLVVIGDAHASRRRRRHYCPPPCQAAPQCCYGAPCAPCVVYTGPFICPKWDLGDWDGNNHLFYAEYYTYCTDQVNSYLYDTWWIGDPNLNLSDYCYDGKCIKDETSYSVLKATPLNSPAEVHELAPVYVQVTRAGEYRQVRVFTAKITSRGASRTVVFAFDAGKATPTNGAATYTVEERNQVKHPFSKSPHRPTNGTYLLSHSASSKGVLAVMK